MRHSILLTLAVLFHFQCQPVTDHQPHLDIDLQGHRGARGLYPENTIPAMLAAVDLGMHTLEMDVVVTQDSVVILSHEPYFSHEIATAPNDTLITKETEKDHNVFGMTYDSVKRYDVGMRPHLRFPNQAKIRVSKPALTEVVAAVNAHSAIRPRYNIEIKRKPDYDNVYHPSMKDYADLVVRAVQQSGISEVTTIQSFDPTTLQYLHSAYPHMSLVYLIGDTTRTAPEQVALLGFTPEVYSPYYKLVDTELMEYCQAQSMKVIPWTVNEEADMYNLFDLGVDGIISDYPDRLRKVYNEIMDHANKK